ncbi:MAG: sigma-70 family RNA polymerase sigma factor, partial [Planctomycetota bacterium]
SYLEAFLRIRSLRGTTAREFEVWLERIAQHNLTDAVRALGRDKRPDARARVTRGASENTEITFLDRLARETRSVTRVATDAESAALLRESLTQLPESYRSVIEACDLEERPVAEVAEAWGRSTGAVHMLRARAHDRLRDILRSWATENPESA